MPGQSKRTRASSNNDDPEHQARDLSENDQPTPSATARRRHAASTSTQPPQPPSTPTRPILTRSAATASPNPPLTRSNSMFLPSRRNGTLGGLSTPTSTFGSLQVPSTGGGRVGTLTRTQSTPSMASPSQLKAAIAGGSGGAGRGKGDGDDDFESRGVKRGGRGKENIPPKKEDENDESGARKRMRANRRSSVASTRARSGSVSSMRSEGPARLPSLAPSSSSGFSRASRLPSPSPSMSSSIATPSLEYFPAYPIGSVDSAESVNSDEMDLDKTPTKPKTRAQAQQAASALPLLTPPPSSPFATSRDVEATAERMGLVRMRSDTSTEDDETATEVDESEFSGRTLNPYKHLKTFLRLSSSKDQTIVGREEELAALKAYTSDVNAHDVGMYVSGPPGTGKTATVTSLGRELRREGWKVVEMGCMGAKLADIWRGLGEQLDCGKTERDVVSHLQSSALHTFIMLDEIDSLLPPPPATAPAATSHLLSKLFSLPSDTAGKVKVVAISNTLDLTLRARLVLAQGATPLVLPFKAYVGADMINIVAARLAAAAPAEGDGVKVDPKAVELLTKKVEAQNGDLRMCLGVLSLAVTLAEGEWTKKAAADPAFPFVKVSLAHTIKAFNSHNQQLKAAAGSTSSSTASVTGKKIRSVPLQGKMVLLAALIFASRVRAGLPGCPAAGHGSASGNATPTSTPTKSIELMTTANLYATYVHLLSHHTSPFPPSSESDYRDLLSNLEVLGLVSVHSGSSSMSRTGSGSSRRGAQGQKVELCVRDDEVKDGLGLGEGVKGKGMAEDEVSKVWEREDSRIKRAKEKLTKAAAAVLDLEA